MQSKESTRSRPRLVARPALTIHPTIFSRKSRTAYLQAQSLVLVQRSMVGSGLTRFAA